MSFFVCLYYFLVLICLCVYLCNLFLSAFFKCVYLLNILLFLINVISLSLALSLSVFLYFCLSFSIYGFCLLQKLLKSSLKCYISSSTRKQHFGTLNTCNRSRMTLCDVCKNQVFISNKLKVYIRSTSHRELYHILVVDGGSFPTSKTL